MGKGGMKISALPLKDAMQIDFAPIGDNRGSFTRVFCADALDTHFKKPVRHVNHSVTAKAGTVRGLHYQTAPALEAKLFRCIRGSLYDVMIDMRAGSPTFLRHYGTTLDNNARALFIPEGFAHGFQTLEDNTEALYMTTAPYNKACEGAVRFDDPLFNIQWPMAVTEISDRDRVIPHLDKNFKGIET